MSRESWLNALAGKVSARDFRILEKASRILLENIAPNEKGVLWNPYRAITPSMTPLPGNPKDSYFAGIWNWDSAFHMVGVSRFDKKLAQEQMEAFFLFQKENGMLPDVIRMPIHGSRVEDLIGKPPVWAWALEMTDRRQPDDAFLAKMYPKLVKNEAFWRNERYCEKDGLFFYSTSCVGEKRVIASLYPVDLNCFMVSFYRSMGYLAGRLGKTEDQKLWETRKNELVGKILTTLCDEQTSCFFDWNFRDHAFVRVVTPAIYMPLWAQVATKEQAAAIEHFATDPKKLYPCMPTVAFDHPKMDPNGYWRGSVWLNVAYFAVKGLFDYGFTKTASAIRETLLDWIDRDDTIHENYNPISGVGKCAPGFSWSCVFAMALVLELPESNG